ncbi:polysaccharide deacetylase family protein [Streptomyces gobiensis]|uniref:polysaccharide deacetylase family protein n=1 Tax=Streptomyces gobiensis TaxID=2875706 RepID=UPI001E4970F9|nr:polysaccharide deacetylase family protein [Streptomyces gobiensis]UGY94272.1 polysaccharide deacetylase family protein [Streptomyces gobiensis]
MKANELASVPVLMYHQVIKNPGSVYDRTPKDFRAELERLAREGYVPVTAAEYSTGKLDIPAGTHPVVLTFDDSTASQLKLGSDGEPVDDCAVGILLDVAKKHPEFRPVATFFVNGEPFSGTGGDKALGWLHKNGFEIGNHTLNHAKLSGLPAAGVQREISANQKAITAHAPGTKVVSMGLPFGIQPDPAGLALSGSSAGVSYKHHGAYLVGSNPAPSPYATSFDPVGIPRIRSAGPDDEDAEFGSSRWLDKLADGTVSRYTSDGDPDRISYPKSSTAELSKKHRDRGRAY